MTGNMTDSNNSNADTDADADTDEQDDKQNRLPYQSVVETDRIWLCMDALQILSRELEGDSDHNTETINKHLRDAQISLQKAKTSRRQALMFNRAFDAVDLEKMTVDEYELETDDDLDVEIEDGNLKR